MIRETRTLQGLFPDPKPPRRKNFIKENVKNLRKIERHFHTSNKSAKDLKLPVLKQIQNSKPDKINNQISNNKRKAQNLKSEELIENGIAKLLIPESLDNDLDNRKKCVSINMPKKSAFFGNRLSRSSLNANIKRNYNLPDQVECKNNNQTKLKTYSRTKMHEKLNENVNNTENIIKCKNQGVQTIDTNDINNLYSEGIIRYPSGGNTESQKCRPSDRGDTTQISDCNEMDTKNFSESLANHKMDYTKMNKERVSITNKLVSHLNNSEPPPSYRIGVVPKYIKERKEALQKEKLAKTAVKQTDCPSGHVPLPDNERKETLSMLKRNYQEYVNELNNLPIKTDTLKSQKRKMEIERQLTKLEEAIKFFSRPKVFVKVES